MEQKRILVVDDEPEVTTFFTYFLKRKQCEVTVANTGREVEYLLDGKRPPFHAALIDLKLPDANGLDIMARIHSAFPSCAVLIMTGYSTIKSAVTAIQQGARDYLEKPFDDLDSIEQVIDTILADTLHVHDEPDAEAAHYGIIYTADSPMAKVLSIAQKLAKKAINILLEGETGTGKELIARYIHGSSARAQYPFVALNCGAVPEALMESELFGHEKGAFTGAYKSRKGFFEMANNGTLFLDEIGEAPPSIQVKLLRALETGDYLKVGGEQVLQSNVRIVSATNRDLEQEVSCKRFRRDLLHRLEGVKLMIPPLRDRVQDIPAICRYYLQKKYGHTCRMDQDALECFMHYDWPGNVRQLLNVLNQTIAIHDCDGLIQARHLPEQIRNRPQPAAPLAPSASTSDLDRLIDRSCSLFTETFVEKLNAYDDVDFVQLIKRIKTLEAEVGRGIIEQSLAKFSGNRDVVCQRLNISKRMIRYYLNEK